MNIELYINNTLCEIQDPKSFGIYLKRVFLNPSELNTKDAQKSYQITLPATPRNNRILGFKNTEEIRGKFIKIYDAYLLIGGIRIFEGKFRLSEIGKNYYTGNLGVPAQKSIKDIFGERMMNDAGEWVIPFGEFADSVKYYNEKENAECIFPYVLYGLLPKKQTENSSYTSKTLWDDTVTFGLNDFPPSVNCLQAIKKIFENEHLNIGGTAYNDEKLTKLYMSYKNPSDYELLWNYGKLGVVRLQGGWVNYLPNPVNQIEKNVFVSQKESDDNRRVYVVNLFDSTNGGVSVLEDSGGNILSQELETDEGIKYKNIIYTVPYSGLYKIKFSAQILLDTSRPNYSLRQNVRVISPVAFLRDEESPTKYTPQIEDFTQRRFEVKVLRDWGESFNINDIGYDRSFYKDNLNQDNIFDRNDETKYPKYFPKPDEVVFVDPLQNKNLVCGLSFGANYGNNNPLDVNNLYCNPIAIKHGLSWNIEADKEAKSAVYNSGYTMWGKTPEGEVDFWVSDKFKTDLINTQTYAKTEDDYTNGFGQVEQVIWLQQGERLMVCTNSDEGVLTVGEPEQPFNLKGWLLQHVNYMLDITPFKTSDEWLKMDDETNASTQQMDWNDTDPTDGFHSDGLNLIKFLPSDIKIDDWLDNFCKAFNLVLTQTAVKTFELNVKQHRKTYSRNVIDLDRLAHIDLDRRNTDLDLPSVYKIGFTIHEDEEGYVRTQEDGGGTYETGNALGSIINQESIFSYNWFKKIFIERYNSEFDLPVITEHEIWQRSDSQDYDEMIQKVYTDLPQRFWYKSDNIEVTGLGEDTITVSLVKNELQGLLILNYHNERFSILNNYFTLFVDYRTNYTIVQCYLNAEEYKRLPYSFVKFNGDLYFPAEIDGYDPLNRRKADIKLIRKLL